MGPRILALPLVLVAALAGCGGGSSSSVLPSSTSANAVKTVFSIAIPAASASAAGRRRPRYVSTGTASGSISVNGQTPVTFSLATGSSNCTPTSSGRTCSVTIAAPVGADTFTETLYDSAGAVLSTGKTSATIVAGQANTVALTLGGAISALSLALTTTAPPVGTAAQIGLTVNLLDASGAAIIGSDPFVTPVTLSDSDTSGATSLSKTTLNSPADAASLVVNYTGAPLAQAVIGATSGSVAAASITIAPLSATVSLNDYPTYGYDNQRTVFNPNSIAITPASLANLHLGWQSTMGQGDYNTQGQPIVASNLGGHQGILVVGGGSGKVYGYDALSGTQLWVQALGKETYTCWNGLTFYFGVGGSAAYDASSGAVYIVGNQNPSANATATNTLYKISASSGTILGSTAFSQPDSTWPSLDFSHTSVTLGSNGLAYVGTSATCDISSWRGRVAAINTASMTMANTFYTVWNGTTQPWGGGGIWGWGGVSLDFSGNVVTGVGNTDNGLTEHGSIKAPFVQAPQEYSGLGEAFISLSPGLSTLNDSQHPIPTSIYAGDSADLDINGTPTVFRPLGSGCDPLAALQSKSGSVYLYDLTSIHSGPIAQYQLAPSSYADGFLGSPAYSSATGLLYVNVASSEESLYPPGMIAIDPHCGSPAVTWHSAFGPDAYPNGVPRSVPAVSAGGVIFVGTTCTPDGNGGCTNSSSTSAIARRTSAATRTANAVRKPAVCCAPNASGDGALWAIDASTGTVLNNGEPLIYTSAPMRAPPTIDGNWIYVLDINGQIYALTIDPSVPTASYKARALDSHINHGWEERPTKYRGG